MWMIDVFEKECVDKCPDYMKLTPSELLWLTDDERSIYIEACKRAACAGSGHFMHTWSDVNELLVMIGWEWICVGNGQSKLQRKQK